MWLQSNQIYHVVVNQIKCDIFFPFFSYTTSWTKENYQPIQLPVLFHSNLDTPCIYVTCSFNFVKTKDTTLFVHIREDFLFAKVQLKLIIYPVKVSNQTSKFSMTLFTINIALLWRNHYESANCITHGNNLSLRTRCTHPVTILLRMMCVAADVYQSKSTPVLQFWYVSNVVQISLSYPSPHLWVLNLTLHRSYALSIPTELSSQDNSLITFWGAL